MDIQHQIKQSQFKSSKQKAHINLIYTFNYLSYSMKNIFKEYKIFYQHYNILKILKGSGGKPLCNNEILDVMLDKTRDLTRLIDKLEEFKWVTKKTNPENKRSVMIQLTHLGLTKTQEIESKVEKWIEDCTYLTDEECENLSFLLDKFRG
jgi:DNA-binding MarR family transcriptional regulator